MKALFLTREYPPHVYGGAGVHVDYLSREIAKRIDLEVRCFGDRDFQEGRLRVRGFGVPEDLFHQADEKVGGVLKTLARSLHFNGVPIEADVVHCHTWYSHMGGILAKHLYGLPLVVTTHSLEPLRPWKREQLGTGYELSLWVERQALEAADCVIAVSREMKKDILRLFPIDPEKVQVVYNGIDTEEYRPVATKDALTRYGIDPAVPYVLFVGRITRQKGIVHLLEAVPHLHPGTQVVLCAGEPDSQEIAREVEAGVRRAQEIPSRLVWIREMVSKETAVELYSHAAVFCCPSIYEPFGIINLEAMACSTAVVASAVGGIREVVVHGETGLLVDMEPGTSGPRDPARFARDLAKSIDRLMEDEPLRRRMGEAGRRRATGIFSWPAIAREVVEIYRTLLDRRG
jgi:alpha-maltose-1-phosphate synthase